MRNEAASLRDVRIDSRQVTRNGTTYQQDGQKRSMLRRKKSLNEENIIESFDEDIVSDDPYYDSHESTKTAYLQENTEIKHHAMYSPPQKERP